MIRYIKIPIARLKNGARKTDTPSKIKFNTKNINEDWRKLGDEFELYKFLSEEEEDKTKLLSLKYSIGADDIEICNTLKINKEENDRTLKGVLVVLNAYCRHKSTETVEEFKYNGDIHYRNEIIRS